MSSQANRFAKLVLSAIRFDCNYLFLGTDTTLLHFTIKLTESHTEL